MFTKKKKKKVKKITKYQMAIHHTQSVFIFLFCFVDFLHHSLTVRLWPLTQQIPYGIYFSSNAESLFFKDIYSWLCNDVLDLPIMLQLIFKEPGVKSLSLLGFNLHCLLSSSEDNHQRHASASNLHGINHLDGWLLQKTFKEELQI